jgi:hypothetical protein
MSTLDDIQRHAQQQFDRQSDRYRPSHIPAEVSHVIAFVADRHSRRCLTLG